MEGIPVLYVHDSFIINSSYTWDLEQRMKWVMEEFFDKHQSKVSEVKTTISGQENTLEELDSIKITPNPTYRNQLKQYQSKKYQEHLFKTRN